MRRRLPSPTLAAATSQNATLVRLQSTAWTIVLLVHTCGPILVTEMAVVFLFAAFMNVVSQALQLSDRNGL
jgi:hypothetical protein